MHSPNAQLVRMPGGRRTSIKYRRALYAFQRLRLVFIGIAYFITCPASYGDVSETIAVLRTAVKTHCESFDAGQFDHSSGEPIRRRGRIVGIRTRHKHESGMIVVERFGPPGRVVRSHLAWYDDHDQPRGRIETGPNCELIGGSLIQTADDERSRYLIRLDAQLNVIGDRVPVNPALPRAPQFARSSNVSVNVGLLDSGVDYRQPWLLQALSYDEEAGYLGWDFHDGDNRPFDNAPGSSVFAPQRHGTRVASVIVDEAPHAEITPYRYPRDAPEALASVVRRAVDDGVRVLNISLGSRDEAEWRPFADALRNAPLLAVVSAGNDGSNLDQRPLYPGSFHLPNVIVVTSANDDGTLARGSGYGRETVDVMVAGEARVTQRFGGGIRRSSGSSFAAARLSALAACEISRTPDISPTKLKAQIINLATGSFSDDRPTAYGFIDLDAVDHAPTCKHAGTLKVSTSASPVAVDGITPEQSTTDIEHDLVLFRPWVIRVANEQWPTARVERMLREAATLLAQCRVVLTSYRLLEVEGPLKLRQISDASMRELTLHPRLVDPSPVVRIFLMDDTIRDVEFGAEAIGRVNARKRPALRDTVWVTTWSPHSGVSLAHELVHVLSDSGLHRDDPTNLMSIETSERTRTLTTAQCGQIRNIGLGNSLLSRATGGTSN